MTNDIITAGALTNLATENYRRAAELFSEGGYSDSGQQCRCKRLLNEIGVAC